MTPARIFGIVGAAYGAVAVIVGAFGAHGLKNILNPYELGLIETSTKYLMFHALALLVTVALPTNGKTLFFAGWFFITGAFIFSLSLILLALTKQTAWGAVTPIGGLLCISGWISLGIHFYQITPATNGTSLSI